MQRVVERPQVGIDLGHQVAGEEAESLPRLDRRSGEDDAVDLLGLQRVHGHGHGEPTLAGTGGPDTEGDDVVADRLDVLLLSTRLGPHHATTSAAQHIGRQHLRRSFVGQHHVDAPTHGRRLEHLTLLQDHHELLEQLTDLHGPLAGHRDLVAPHMHGGIGEGILDQAEELVVLAEQADHEVVAGDVDADGGRHVVPA